MVDILSEEVEKEKKEEGAIKRYWEVVDINEKKEEEAIWRTY